MEKTVKTTEKDYELEVEKLKLFSVKWNSYVNQTVRKYPSNETRKLALVGEIITEILSSTKPPVVTAKEKVDAIYKLIEKEGVQETKKPSLYGESESGFNMDDVLNPKGELDLKTLLNELGVTD